MTRRKKNFALDEEDVFDTIMLMAKNDGDAYRNNKNATQAVDNAIRQFRKDVGADAREETADVRSRVIADLNAYWKSLKNNPCKAMQLHNPSGDAVAVIHVKANNDSDGNPRRLYMVISDDGRVIDVIDEGYDGDEAYKEKYPTIQTEIPIKLQQGEYRRILSSWKKVQGRKGNPSFKIGEPVRGSIGAALGGALGSLGGPATAAVVAAVGSLIGSNWKKIMAGTKAGTRAYRSTARANNPGLTTAALVGKLKF